MPRKPTKLSSRTESGALTSQQRELALQEAQVKAEFAKAQRVIAEAPKLQAERERREEEKRREQREYATARDARNEHHFGSPARLTDWRCNLNTGLPTKKRQLRAERNRGRLMFFVLLAIFACAILWLYFTINHG